MSADSYVKNVLNKLGFDHTKCEYDVPKIKYECKFCNTSKPHIGEFECLHFCCTDCLDVLYDNYDSASVELLFECPFCRQKVKEIILK